MIKFASALKKQLNKLELKLETDIEDLEKNCFLVLLKNFMIKNRPWRALERTKSRL